MIRMDPISLSISPNKMLVFLHCLIFLSCTFVHCASVSKSSDDNSTSSLESVEDYLDTEIHKSGGLERNLHPIPLNNNHNPYISPYHQNLMFASNNQAFLNPHIVSNPTVTGTPTSAYSNSKKDKRGGGNKRKVSGEEQDKLDLEQDETDESHRTSKKQLGKGTNEKNGSNDSSVALLDPKSKTDDGDGRGCPACGGSDCSANNNISGLPVIQIIAAIKAGLIWAKIFLFIYKNFVSQGSHEESHHGGYGYSPTPAPSYGPPPAPSYGPPPAPSYGPPPAPSYGPPPAPAPAYGPPPTSSYGAPSTSSGGGGGWSRRRVGATGKEIKSDSIAETVLNAISTLSKAYEDG